VSDFTVEDDPLVARMRPHAKSIFGEMSQLASRTQSINLGQGFPDTDGPIEVTHAAIRAIESGEGNQYPPAHGFPALRQAITSHQKRFYSINLNPDTDVVVTTGASEAIASSLLALVEPGHEVAFFDPAFDVYRAGIDLAGATPVGVPFMVNADGQLRPDIDRLAGAITPRTRVLLMNSPHNPTGVVFTPEEMQGIANIAIEHNLVVISDEAYEHLWFPGHRHIPFATLDGMAERTITIGSGGKSFSFTGWKVGWATGPSNLIAAVRAVRQHLSYVSGGPFQVAMVTALGLPDEYFTEFRNGLHAQRDQLSTGLAHLGLRVLPTEGTYFLSTDISSLGYTDGMEFCRMLPPTFGVAAIPFQVFTEGGTGFTTYVRWAFCKKPEVLGEALSRLSSLGRHH
jgi:N-succinyldiaminopimelate aminotransferase